MSPKPAGNKGIPEHRHVISTREYHALRDAFAKNTFEELPDSKWPTAPLRAGRRECGRAQLIPAAVIEDDALLTPEQQDLLLEAMWNQHKEIYDSGDLAADAMDALSIIFLERATGPDANVPTGVDDLLDMRGLKPKLGGKGRRGGYTAKQRAEILQAVSHVANVWMTVPLGSRRGRQEVCQSRAFIITDRLGQIRFDHRVDVSHFIFRPGSIFGRFLWGTARKVALLSAKALQYDRYRQKWEKRLARYLSWQWRVRARNQNYEQPYRVSALLDAAGGELDPRRPMRTKTRLEGALEFLRRDGVIGGWRYKDWAANTRAHGWSAFWLSRSIIIEPLASIRQAYSEISR